MLRQLSFIAAVAAVLALAGPAGAQVSITQAKAQAGNITPGDAAGFPISISQSGSYRLDSNLTVPNGANGIQVQVANVTIDLNGFTIEGNGAGVIGIFGNSIADSVTVENGTIQRFRQDGIYTATGDFWHIDSVRVLRNGRTGITADRYLHLSDSTIVSNGSNGIAANDAAVIQGNAIGENKGLGVVAFEAAAIVGNTIYSNTGRAIEGFEGGFANNTLVSNNSASAPQTTYVSPMNPNYCNVGCP